MFCADDPVCKPVFFRRKRGERGEVVETTEDVIVEMLRKERIEELKKEIRDVHDQYK